jgi:hypothetical protein
MSEASERAARMLQKRLNQRHCELWPECGCHETLAKWANDLSDEEKIWPMDLFEWAETSIFITLACVARYCPDPATKLYAKEQLQKGFWDRQKSMGIHVEP